MSCEHTQRQAGREGYPPVVGLKTANDRIHVRCLKGALLSLFGCLTISEIDCVVELSTIEPSLVEQMDS